MKETKTLASFIIFLFYILCNFYTDIFNEENEFDTHKKVKSGKVKSGDGSMIGLFYTKNRP